MGPALSHIRHVMNPVVVHLGPDCHLLWRRKGTDKMDVALLACNQTGSETSLLKLLPLGLVLEKLVLIKSFHEQRGRILGNAIVLFAVLAE